MQVEEIFLKHYYEEIDKNKQRISSETKEDIPFLWHKLHSNEEKSGEEEIKKYRFHRVIDRILCLSYNITQSHASGISRKTCPSTSYITILRNEVDVDCYEHRTAYKGEPGSPDGAVYELIPEREVEVDTHHYFCCHHNRYCTKTCMIVRADNVLQEVHITNDAEEGKEGENNEVLHCLSIIFLGITVFRLGKYNGFVGITECLSNHCHNHGYLNTSTVDTQFDSCFGRGMNSSIGISPKEDNLIECLIQYASNTQDEDGPRIREHTAHKTEIYTPTYVGEFRDEEESNERGADQIEEEYIIDVVLSHSHKVYDVKAYIHDDEEHLQRREFDGLLTETEEGERNGLKGIDRHAYCHYLHIFRVGTLPDCRGDFIGEEEYASEEYRHEQGYHCHSSGKDGMVVFPLFIGKAEEGGFHSEGKDDKHECHKCVQVGDDAISAVCCRYHMCIEWYKQIVQESAYNRRHTVYRRVLRKRF